jgi:hypothetical protein
VGFVFVACKGLPNCLVTYSAFVAEGKGRKGVEEARKAGLLHLVFRFMSCACYQECMRRVISELRMLSSSWRSASLFPLIVVLALLFSTSSAGLCD